MARYFFEIEDFWKRNLSSLRVKTSGSTGKPKEISLARKTLIESAQRTIGFFRLNKKSRLHSCISPETIGGTMVLIRALECGGEFSYEAPSNVPLRKFGRRRRLTMVSVVPSQMFHILERHEAGTLPTIQAILIGGSPIPPDLRKRIAASGLPCWESYGMTETASHIAVRRVTEKPEWFTPLPGIKVIVGGSGCLVISGVTRVPIFTNDLAELDEEGRFRILGRRDNVIISGGRKIIPEELEHLLRLFLSDRLSTVEYEFEVCGFPDKKWGRHTAVVYECADIDAHAVHEELVKASEKITPRWMRPKHFIWLPFLPRTDNGKLARKSLELLLKDLYQENNE